MFEIVPGKGVKSDQGLGCRDAFKSRKFHGDRVRDLLIALDTNDCHQIVPSSDLVYFRDLFHVYKAL